MTQGSDGRSRRALDLITQNFVFNSQYFSGEKKSVTGESRKSARESRVSGVSHSSRGVSVYYRLTSARSASLCACAGSPSCTIAAG